MARHRRVPGLALLSLLSLVAPPPLAVAAEPAFAGPWDVAAGQAAEAAVARLGDRRALALVPTVLAIRGGQLGVTGAGQGIVATVQQVRQAMTALGATETDLEVRVELPADVLFDFDKAEIRADAATALSQLATVLRGYPDGHATLGGHTDAKGNAAYNQKLSERRAEAVERWLVEKEKIDAGRLTTRGYGKTRPVASNDTDAGRQKNRRVEVVIRKR
jgi:outer membrane protein OmpA-like peptidoglycan-associated protein